MTIVWAGRFIVILSTATPHLLMNQDGDAIDARDQEKIAVWAQHYFILATDDYLVDAPEITGSPRNLTLSGYHEV